MKDRILDIIGLVLDLLFKIVLVLTAVFQSVS